MSKHGRYGYIFEQEKRIEYREVDGYEKYCGFALDKLRLLGAAKYLACPLKRNPPNWQHGRVIYATLRKQLANLQGRSPWLCVDIGTAKGFSALCARWALDDAKAAGHVRSVDVIDPAAPYQRNTVADVEGKKTLHEILVQWPDAQRIEFSMGTGVALLKSLAGSRVNFAFVDGKHTYPMVSEEAALLHALQESGDVIVFDDVQVTPVARAIVELQGYDKEYLAPLPNRCYCIARKQ